MILHDRISYKTKGGLYMKKEYAKPKIDDIFNGQIASADNCTTGTSATGCNWGSSVGGADLCQSGMNGGDTCQNGQNPSATCVNGIGF